MSPSDAAAPSDAASDNPPSRNQTVERGDLVQLDPHADLNGFEGSILCVDEVRSWGVIGFVQVPRGGRAFFRAVFGSFTSTGGKAAWMLEHSGDQLGWVQQGPASGGVLPAEMTPAIEEVLGQVNFIVSQIAHALQAAGEQIPKKYEAEQAHVLFRFLHLALQHGDGWRQKAGEPLKAALDAAKAKQAGEGAAP